MSDSEGPALALRDVARRNAASRVRRYVDEIQIEVDDGASVDEMVVWLAEQKGITVSKRNLEQILYRARKKARRQGNGAEVARPPARPSATPTVPQSSGALPRPPAALAARQADDVGLADVLDPKKRDAFADKYVNQKPRLFAAKTQGEN